MDKSENLGRINHFEKFNKANRIFFLQKMLDFSSIMGRILTLKIGDNLIWDGTLCMKRDR